MSTEVNPFEATQQVDFEDYRALSAAAVASVLLGLLSGFSFMTLFLGVIPIVGVVTGLYALRQVRRRSAELTGRGLAWVGIGLSVFCLVGSWVTIGVVYATEVPDGYERISYAVLQPEPGEAIPSSARELEGKKVFIKGFIFPGGANTRGLTHFLLVRDQGTCCFGGNPKITDRIEVTLVKPLYATFNTRINKLSGTFHVEQKTDAVDAGGAVYYHLTADHWE